MLKINKILFLILILFFSSLVLVSYFHTWQVKNLKGKYKKTERPKFTASQWLDGSYQKKMDGRTKSHFIIRSILIKLRNHLDFHLFDKVNAGSIKKGKENILFERKYIESYLGKNLVGRNLIKHKVQRLQFMQDDLARRNKNLLVVIAPNKAFYYRDHLPSKYDRTEKRKSNYDHFKAQLLDKGISHIDFNQSFFEMKDTTSYPLYGKQGTHWTAYGYHFAWNTIVDSLESETEWNLARLIPGKITLEKPRGRDRDLYHVTNIYSLDDSEKLAYPNYSVDTTGTDLPNGLVVGDSYFWGLKELGFSQHVLGGDKFWYYNNIAYAKGYQKEQLTPREHKLPQVIENTDIIVILTTAANMDLFPFGFEEDYYQAMINQSNDSRVWETSIDSMVTRIRNNKEWFGDLQKQSSEKNQSLDSLMRVAAGYFLDQQKK